MDACYYWVYSSLRENLNNYSSSLSQCSLQVTTVIFSTTVPQMSLLQQATPSSQGEGEIQMSMCD